MSGPLHGKNAIVTGASQGIGRAIVLHLAQQGADVTLAGRASERLRETLQSVDAAGGKARVLELDLSDRQSIARCVHDAGMRTSSLDILVNCGGIYARGRWQESPVEVLEKLLETNVSGTYALTRGLLPMLVRAQGDVVFVNSSIAHSDGTGAGQFAASQHALKGLADSLRAEVNGSGVRVLSIFPGRTATPRQATIHETEGGQYRPERLLQPDDVARIVGSCLALPDTAEVMELKIRPRHKA